MNRTALFLSPIVLLMACDPNDPGNDTDEDTSAVDRVARVVVTADGATGDMVAGHNALAFDLYAELADDDDGNVFFSPFSTTAALGMTYAGANGTTEAEMASVLGVTGDEAAWHTALGSLTRDLNGTLGRGYTLNIANRLFGQTDYAFEADFLAVCDDAYGAPLEEWDFVSDPAGGREHVNTWVEEQTEDRIVDLLPPDAITTDTRLVLANAIYFLADWKTQFDPELTYDGAFTTASGGTVTTPLMNMDLGGQVDHGIETGRTDDLAIVRLPYKDDELSMILVVPDATDGLGDLEAALSADTYATWLDALSPSSGRIVMPSFTMEYEVELSAPLTALGMPSAFNAATADFTGIADTSEDLFISGVFHKAFVAVDELGTEAAAATAVVIGVESAADTIVADHPFLFVIQDDLTGAILFVGRITDPS